MENAVKKAIRQGWAALTPKEQIYVAQAMIYLKKLEDNPQWKADDGHKY